MRRPKFTDLIGAQQAHFGNGLGPYWLSDRARHFITYNMSWFFEDASWRHHDFGYAVGGDRWDRARCDWKFFKAMWRDALTQCHWSAVPLALFLSALFYIAVRIGGQFGSFEYRDRYATIEEVVEAYGPYWRPMAIMEPRWYRADLHGQSVDLRPSWDETEWLLWEMDQGPDTPLLLKTGENDLTKAVQKAERWLRENGMI